MLMQGTFYRTLTIKHWHFVTLLQNLMSGLITGS
jgi:hypothetical protein